MSEADDLQRRTDAFADNTIRPTRIQQLGLVILLGLLVVYVIWRTHAS